MSALPRVSIVVPCHEAEGFLAETLDSALAQTHRPLEVIAVDDASRDGTPAVLARYAGRVRTLRLDENGGGSRARNRGAALATGTLLMFLDADDLLAPDAVAGMVEALAGREGAIALAPWRRLAEVEGRWTRLPAEIPFPDVAEDPLPGWMTGRAWAPPCCVLWPRALYDATGGWDESLAANQDGDLVMRALAAGGRLVAATRGEALYRAHGDARVTVSTDRFSERRMRSRMRVLEKLAEILRAEGRLPRYAEALAEGYRGLARDAVAWNAALARECLDAARRHAPAPARERASAGRTRLGRALAALLGIEAKERLARAVARAGVMTGERRRVEEMRARQAGRSA